MPAVLPGRHPVNPIISTRYNVCRLKWWQTFKPQAGCLRLSMPEHPRLNDLRLSVVQPDDSLGVLVHDRVLNADPRHMLKIEKQFEELSPFLEPIPSGRISQHPPNTAVAEIRAGWVSNHQVPLLIQNLRYITLDVKLARWIRWEDVTGVCLKPEGTKRIAYGPAEFTRNKDSGHYSLHPIHCSRYAKDMP